MLVVLLLAGGHAWAVQRFPPPDFESGYRLPDMLQPAARAGWLAALDVGLLLVALSAAAWLALRRRSRRGIAILSVLSLAYFGFYRAGCICPVGSLQHVALSLADSSYILPLSVAVFFVLPLAFALLFGRVFCGGVCPLGAMQDVVLIKPVKLPEWAARALSVGPFVYLGLAVLYAATGTGFIICRYDPFVSFFRLSGPLNMLIFGGVVLAVAAFIGRPYCRFLCPYGALLGFVSRWSWRKVSTTPDECIVCGLCENACPFGAIVPPTPQGVFEE